MNGHDPLGAPLKEQRHTMAKQASTRTPLRTTLRKVIGLHRAYVESLIKELDRGAQLEGWIEKLKRECRAAPELIDVILRERKARA